MDIKALHGNSGGQATSLALFVESAGEGIGSVKDVVVRNIRAREQGMRNSLYKALTHLLWLVV